MKYLKPLKVAIIYDGFSTVSYDGLVEDIADTLATVENLKKALGQMGYDVFSFEVNGENINRIGKIEADLIFNLVEDQGWKLAHRALKIMERHEMPFVGANFLGTVLANNKLKVKRKLVGSGIPTPKFQFFSDGDEVLNKDMGFPLIVKPATEHAGIGISQASVVRSEQKLRERVRYIVDRFGCGAVVEEYIEGREIHATVIGNDKLIVLPLAEILYEGKFLENWKIYSYEAKWVSDSWEFRSCPVKAPADLEKKVSGQIEVLAKKAFREFGGRDYMRFDIRVRSDGQIYLLDVNTNPSLKEDELDATTISARAFGWSYAELIHNIAEASRKRIFKERLASKNFAQVRV